MNSISVVSKVTLPLAFGELLVMIWPLKGAKQPLMVFRGDT